MPETKRAPLSTYYKKPEGVLPPSNPNAPVYDGNNYIEQHPSTGYAQSRTFLEQHPSLGAINASKSYDYVSGTGNDSNATAQSIQLKENRLKSYFPTTNMPKATMKQYMQTWANTDPAKYAEVKRLAADVSNFYAKNPALRNEKYPRSVGRALNETFNPFSTRIDDVCELADSISTLDRTGWEVSMKNGTVTPTVSSPVQDKCVKEYKSIYKDAPRVPTLDGTSLLTEMYRIKQAYEYELKFNESLPNNEQTARTKAASEQRLDAYEYVWNSCTQRYAELSKDPRQLRDFLEAYIKTPLDPMDRNTRLGITKYVSDLSAYIGEDNTANMPQVARENQHLYSIGGSK